ncbi:hypothetical protein QR680_015516 [Steinernema hermaphroditum]|uniref:Uncharacterized protein n=1 Tax=Steinernema hermaphroditum TaxID=289476 RepID=A0AA39H7Y6_9BILA|nr:hypothetical protein QR680_015516 [Steinernema hermaphroditum]
MPDSLDEAIALMRYSDFLSKMTVIVNKVDMYMSFVVLPLSLVILLLSAVSVPKSLTRTFCLHMSVQCLLASVYYMGTEIYKEIYTRNYSIVDDRYRKFADIWLGQ